MPQPHSDKEPMMDDNIAISNNGEREPLESERDLQ